MKFMEQFNRDVNDSDHTRYHRWKNYRDQVSMFIDKHTVKHDDHHLLIIGAGHCDDLNLSFLKNRFKHVTLSDIDLKAMEDGIRNQDLSVDAFQLIRTDYTGFESVGFFESLIDDLFKMKTEQEIVDYCHQKSVLARQVSGLSQLKDTYDFIIITPIYTQLIYHQALNSAEVLLEMGYPNHLVDIFNASMLDEMPEIIDSFNAEITRLTKKNGTVLVISDIFQSQVGDDFDQRIARNIHSTKLMDAFHESYQKTYGYGLGDYGLYDLSSHMEISDSEWLIWPFEEKLNLTVNVVLYNKKG